MNKYKYVPIIICGLAMFLSAQQTFPVCAFHVDDTLWFEGAGEDSLGF